MSLIYSHYDDSKNTPMQTDADEYWSSGKPAARSYSAGMQHGADAVILPWRSNLSATDCFNWNDREIEVYMLDVEKQCRFSIKGDETSLEALTKRLLTRVINGPVKQAERTQKE